jgi:hypothetical protein
MENQNITAETAEERREEFGNLVQAICEKERHDLEALTMQRR